MKPNTSLEVLLFIFVHTDNDFPTHSKRFTSSSFSTALTTMFCLVRDMHEQQLFLKKSQFSSACYKAVEHAAVF